MVRVSRVQPGSMADEMGIVPGTELLTVNGRELADFLDWEFLTADDELEIEAKLPDGEHIVFEVERPEGEGFGLELEPPNIRRCANRCEFCFIEGLPKGLRKQLYVRDDDYRLSFAYGNFATLSNLKDRDIARILEYRLSPLYVSVHATPWEARKVLLNNPRVPNILDQLTKLTEGGIQFHGQMVVVPGLNDGDVLEQSLTDLWSFGDACLSVAIVPVGLTQFSHLYTGRSMDASIDGRGFFISKTSSGQEVYSRVGIFTKDGNDFLVDSAGRRVQGAKLTPGVAAPGPKGDILVPTTTLAGAARFRSQLDAGHADGGGRGGVGVDVRRAGQGDTGRAERERRRGIVGAGGPQHDRQEAERPGNVLEHGLA